MGYWHADKEGGSLYLEETGIVWGDAPADILDTALEEIIAVFIRDVGRKPTVEELIGGMKFSAGVLEEEET